MAEIVAAISHEARRSPHVNQRSGVSVRLSIANYETMVANATRRALRLGESEVVPRVSDLEALAASTAGKVEIETLDEGGDGAVLDRLVKAAVLAVFRPRCPMERFRDAAGRVRRRARSSTPATTWPPPTTWRPLAGLPGAAGGGPAPGRRARSPAAVASAVELVLEGLHLSRRLNKDAAGGRATYRGRW